MKVVEFFFFLGIVNYNPFFFFFTETMAYTGVHETNYRNSSSTPINNNKITKNKDYGGYNLEIFLNQENAKDYVCTMYACI